MSRFFPHAAYAEDQPLPKTILTTHVLHRGFTAGALIGTLIGSTRILFRKSSPLNPPIFPTILRSTGYGSAVGTGLLALALAGRMWGREPIEWADRSWRLLENKGQVEVDTWCVAGMGVGTAAVVGSGLVASAAKGAAWRVLLGGAGMGNLVGMLGYMGYRHGMRGGKWEEEEGRVRVNV